MTQQEVEVRNYPGIHAHPAGLFVKRASQFEAEIEVSKGDMWVNGKSIMGVLMLAAETGSRLVIRANGPDEKEAVASLVELVDSKFGEAS
ncbi:MAG: HPr family phosphocarrier protein [Candidatus Eisenbacteria bacterium]|uniref:HPr family phosphocarrier protein n=1 Tax=Eiseniibacteriota bacterium TaxID=2212470 RepID=A0A956N9F6_UNCEI|nr:HPr family phosphocarrier protein [Candidatus Eisenbacteria bacterium]MCB9462553.1 HPr family phosphocarrier protein [Candidatus Eisenbacteria bacterium]